ncbi:RNA-directed RNA polymerase 2 [Crepidotus variabilis]|uniref:RNA-dependent RNA polymerase n=1 Tax=Crepidotus variabilis TaxID=179855 RepID=A0A9P6JX39_9AGAR|nr:RNA-directed RNA polymerase 2 [Crepidotus variabilis]
MDIFMRNIDHNVSTSQVANTLANILHDLPFTNLSPTPFNFHVHLHRHKTRPFLQNGGTGTLTLPNFEAGQLFLHIYQPQNPPDRRRPVPAIVVGTRQILFVLSNKPPRQDVLDTVRLLPYQEPRVTEERERRQQQLDAGAIPVNALQFGWECRDSVFSIECETQCENRCAITFQDERREIRVKIHIDDERYLIIMPFPSVREITAHTYLGTEHAIVFSLHNPPSYQKEVALGTQGRQARSRERLSYLPIEEHQRLAPYASLGIRVVCRSGRDLREFRRLCETAQLHKLYDYEYPVERRSLFSEHLMLNVRQILRQIDWVIAFQMQGLIWDLAIDLSEATQLLPEIIRVRRERGKLFAAIVIQKFKPHAQYFDNEEEGNTSMGILDRFRQVEEDISKQQSLVSPRPTDGSIYDSYHVEVTPTTIHLDGPFPEQSNRVIRAYEIQHQQSFLRVSFVDEAKLQYRYDREVDGSQFIRSRVGSMLFNGLEIAGRHFDFLAYSQSALKEHAVWFVKPFRDVNHGIIDAQSIIASLGTFDGLHFDEGLIYCPARYAARISQAFTATDAVRVEVEEVFEKEDITTNDGKYQFTDGVGTLSLELSKAIHRQLRKSKGRRRRRALPPAYQVRFRGSKGMLSVDHTLQGSAICLRPSMIKFLTPDTDGAQDIEIARAFDRPGSFYLNRPLIMLLEDLGVPYEVFKNYQDDAVQATRRAASSLRDSATLLESHGLGTAYHLPSVLNNLEKLYIHSLPNNTFYEKMLDFAVNHVLRDLKNHARIPIPEAWTLVGVADVHKYLQPDEIFACVKPLNGSRRYLEGPVLISRSPVIHPGDVRIVRAIGPPPERSPFAIEPLANTVVFSVRGNRPVPSCLGGGDLDGDLYNLIPFTSLPEFFPPSLQLYAPASYDPAIRKLLDRPSTMRDVAEFFMDYISSDVVGIIATNWLIIADQSVDGIRDEDCLKLAALHSDAVDYPKSGQPVPLEEIPKLKHKIKPDWNAPETVNVSSGNYYESRRAIGRLFREIDLPIEQIPHVRRRGRRPARVGEVEELEHQFHQFNLDGARGGTLFTTVEHRVQDFIWTDRQPTDEQTTFISQTFRRYATELKAVCMACTLSHSHSVQLSEAEAIIGTIAQKSSQPRRRKELMSNLRERTDTLVRGIREELDGDESVTLSDSLIRAWMAWEFAVSQGQTFGAQSFGWLALGCIFDTIKELEDGEED